MLHSSMPIKQTTQRNGKIFRKVRSPSSEPGRDRKYEQTITSPKLKLWFKNSQQTNVQLSQLLRWTLPNIWDVPHLHLFWNCCQGCSCLGGNESFEAQGPWTVNKEDCSSSWHGDRVATVIYDKLKQSSRRHQIGLFKRWSELKPARKQNPRHPAGVSGHRDANTRVPIADHPSVRQLPPALSSSLTSPHFRSLGCRQLRRVKAAARAPLAFSFVI